MEETNQELNNISHDKNSYQTKEKSFQYIDPLHFPSDTEVIILSACYTAEDCIESNDAASVAEALSYHGYNVRLVTSKNNIHSWNTSSNRITIELINTILPNIQSDSILNYWFYGLFFLLTSTILALWMIFFCKFLSTEPNLSQIVFICDTHPIAILILKCFGNFRVIYFQKFKYYKNLMQFQLDRKYYLPIWFHSFIIQLADDIIVENKLSAKIFHKIFPHCKTPKYLYPCIDTGNMVIEEYGSIQKLIPTITHHSHIFLTYGEFESESNFELAIDAFDLVYKKLLRRKECEKVILIIAGNYKDNNSRQQKYYKFLIKYACSKQSAVNIFVMTKLTTIKKKTLLTYSLVLLYTYKCDMTARQILEAMYIGRPVIAVLNRVTGEYLPKDAGYLVEPTPICFAQAMLNLLDDYKLAEKYGSNAKSYFSIYFSFMCFLKKLVKIVSGDVQNCEHYCQSIIECYSEM